jgi:hypothetical protein
VRIAWAFMALILIMSSASIAVDPNAVRGQAEGEHVVDHSQPSAQMELSYTSRWESASHPLGNGEIAVGDHVVLTATVTAPTAEHEEVLNTRIEVTAGFFFQTNAPLVVPSGDPGVMFWDVIDPSYFAWVNVIGLAHGDIVLLTGNFTNGDSDFMAWRPETPPSERTYANNLLGADMATGDKPESGSFEWMFDTDSMEVACLCYDRQPGNFTLTISSLVSVDSEESGSMVSVDTYLLGRNVTANIQVTAVTNSSTVYSFDAQDVVLRNFFSPTLEIHAPVDLGESLYRFSWSSTDANADDINLYSVWLSGDGGVSYNLLARNLSVSTYDWNSAGFLLRDYIYRVRAYSIDLTTRFEIVPGQCWPDDVILAEDSYWPGDYTDGFSYPFRAGQDTAPPSVDIQVSSPQDRSHTLGDSGVPISWVITAEAYGYVSNPVDYIIYLDGTNVRSGSLYISWQDIVEYDTSQLGVGLHNVTLEVFSTGPSGGLLVDTVMVTVYQDAVQLLRYFTIGTGIGSVAVIALCTAGILLSLRMKRGKRREPIPYIHPARILLDEDDVR